MKQLKILLVSFALLAISSRIEASPVEEFQCNPCESICDTGSLTFYGQYLYWKAVQDGMQYAVLIPGGIQPIINEINQGVPLNIRESLSFIDPSFEYQSGYRLGGLYETESSNWDILFQWTHLHEEVSSHVSEPNGGVFPLNAPVTAVFGFINQNVLDFGFTDRAKSKWKLEFNTLDLQLGKTYSFFNCLKSRPYLGLKAACIKQHQKINYLGFFIEAPILVEIKKKNCFRGIGPSFGMDSSWEFCQGFNLTGGICGSVLYGKFDAKTNPLAAQTNNSIHVSLKNNKKNRLRPVVDARIGIDWNSCFCNRFDVLIGISYEVQYWWNQWQAPTSVATSIISGGNSCQGDLMMQGLTLSAAVKF